MKGLRLISVLALLVLTAGCRHPAEPSSDDMANYRGTIIEQWAGTFLIESDVAFQNYGKTFYPLNLDNAFKINGFRVLFSGKIEIDPTAQYILPPIRLSRIKSIMR